MTWQNGPLLGFDLETTGVDPLTARPVQFAFAWYDFRTFKKKRHALVNPGCEIPPESIAIHGKTQEDVEARGGDLEKSIKGVAGILIEEAKAQIPLVGMNLRYDLTVIDTQLRRFQDGKGLRESGWHGHVIDVSVIDRRLDQWRKGSRKLADLCENYKVTNIEEHDAAGDACAAVELAMIMYNEFPAIRIEPSKLHEKQIGWRREWVVSFNEYRARKGEKPIDEAEGNWPMASDEPIPGVCGECGKPVRLQGEELTEHVCAF